MMVFGSGDDVSVFSNSAQDVSNLVINGYYIFKEEKGSKAWQQFRIMLVWRRPSGSGSMRLETCLILWILNEDSKCLQLRVAVCAKHTLQKKVSCLQQMSFISTGHIQVKSGSDLDYYLGQWIIRVSGTDPVSTLILTYCHS